MKGRMPLLTRPLLSRFWISLSHALISSSDMTQKDRDEIIVSELINWHSTRGVSRP